jgi:hypothetical protein
MDAGPRLHGFSFDQKQVLDEPVRRETFIEPLPSKANGNRLLALGRQTLLPPRIRPEECMDRFQQPRPRFLVQGKRPVRHEPGNVIMFDGFGLGVLGELGASRFRGPKRVRAKDAKDAKVRKGDY